MKKFWLKIINWVSNLVVLVTPIRCKHQFLRSFYWLHIIVWKTEKNSSIEPYKAVPSFMIAEKYIWWKVRYEATLCILWTLSGFRNKDAPFVLFFFIFFLKEKRNRGGRWLEGVSEEWGQKIYMRFLKFFLQNSPLVLIKTVATYINITPNLLQIDYKSLHNYVDGFLLKFRI